uniref:Uncharacterized protein n=1 Tax=Rhinolophus ferrumequinum TaxID=59479 RepID=A0A671FQK4_RHIFE
MFCIVSDLICSRTHLFIFLVVQGMQKVLHQHHILNEPFFFFLSAYFTVQLLHPYIAIEEMRVWMALALVSNDTSLLLMIFPNSLSLPFQVSAFS